VEELPANPFDFGRELIFLHLFLTNTVNRRSAFQNQSRSGGLDWEMPSSLFFRFVLLSSYNHDLASNDAFNCTAATTALNKPPLGAYQSECSIDWASMVVPEALLFQELMHYNATYLA